MQSSLASTERTLIQPCKCRLSSQPALHAVPWQRWRFAQQSRAGDTYLAAASGREPDTATSPSGNGRSSSTSAGPAMNDGEPATVTKNSRGFMAVQTKVDVDKQVNHLLFILKTYGNCMMRPDNVRAAPTALKILIAANDVLRRQGADYTLAASPMYKKIRSPPSKGKRGTSEHGRFTDCHLLKRQMGRCSASQYACCNMALGVCMCPCNRQELHTVNSSCCER
jgi:hypothetical protein